MANRDAQTLIQGFRQKFPQYKDVDDSTLLSGIQKKYPQYADISMDSLPKSENFLERAINMSSRTTPVGASALDSVPETLKSLFQIGQGTVGNLPQNVVENPVTTAMSGLPGVQMKAGGAMFEDMYNLSNDVLSRFNMAPTEQKTYPFEGDVVPGMDIDIGKMTRPLTEMFMNPQTTRGKIVSGIGNAAAGSIPFTSPNSVSNVASLPGKMIDPFRTKGLQNTFDSLPMAENEIIKGIQSDYGNVSPFISGKGKIGEELKNIEDLGTSKKGISELFKSKRTELTRKRVSDLKSVKDEIEKLSYSGSKNVEEKVSTLFKEANSKFGEGLKNINSSMTDEDMAQIINNAAKDIGAQDIPGTPGNQMKHFSSRYGPKETEGIIQL